MIINKFTETDGTFPIADTNDSAVLRINFVNDVRTGIFHCQNTNAQETNVTLKGSMDGETDSYVTVHTFSSLQSDGTDAASAVVTLFPYMKVSQDQAGSIRAYLGE